MVKVTKFELPTVYRFSTADGRTSLWADSAPPLSPPACLGLSIGIMTSRHYLSECNINGEQERTSGKIVMGGAIRGEERTA